MTQSAGGAGGHPPRKPPVVVRTRNRSRVPGADRSAALKPSPPSDARRAAPPPDCPPSPAAALEALAERVARLTVSRRDPDRFFEEKSEIAEALRRLARARR